MKIAYLSSATVPSTSANSLQVMKMCQAFSQEGHEVHLILPPADETPSDEAGGRYPAPASGDIPLSESLLRQYGLASGFLAHRVKLLPLLGRRGLAWAEADEAARISAGSGVHARDRYRLGGRPARLPGHARDPSSADRADRPAVFPADAPDAQHPAGGHQPRPGREPAPDVPRPPQPRTAGHPGCGGYRTIPEPPRRPSGPARGSTSRQKSSRRVISEAWWRDAAWN